MMVVEVLKLLERRNRVEVLREGMVEDERGDDWWVEGLAHQVFIGPLAFYQ